MESKIFKTVSIKASTIIQKDGIEIKSYIAGVNSGIYGIPFVISVETWASKWGFKKFFHRKLSLGLEEMTDLRDELDKAIKHLNR
jgi:hypothetical protein